MLLCSGDTAPDLRENSHLSLLYDMTANTQSSSSSGFSYDHDQNTNVDSTRGNILTDIQMATETTPMPSSTTQMALNDTTTHEIRSILERPVNLGTYNWSSSAEVIPIQLSPADYTADKVNYLQQFNFPQDIFTNSPIVVDKLKNYQYFKADIEIEVKINVQPFLQGALMLVYNPYYNQTGDFRRKGTRFLASQTSCPYKIVSVEEGNSIKLICPYANIYDLFDLGNSDNQFGTVFLYVFSSLRGSEVPTSAKYTVFARFINPQFSVPTQRDVLSTYRDAHEIKRLEEKGYRVAQASVAPVAASDTGEVETPGPVSKIASGVTTVADVLTDVPLIGRIASTVAWVSRAVGKTAATFGWSKPTSINPQSLNIVKPNNTLIHSEGNDDATTLAMLQDNGIDGSSFIPETKDEMSFSYTLGRPNYFHAQTASTTLFSARKLITSWEVSPFSKYQYGNTADSQTMFLGSFAYTSMMGTLWRGSINYDIMVVKTPFHQGRFAVVFLPETTIDNVPATLGELLNTNYNIVCNLKDRQDELGRTTFRINVPFISNTPWRETYRRTTATTPGPDASTLDTSTGCVAIYSLVDLTNPPTVSGDVSFYIAHSAGEDYQIARPVMNLAPGYQTRYAQSDIGAVFVPEDENLLVPSHKTQDVTAQTTGEYFQSFRALMKRFGRFGALSQTSEYVGLKTRTFTEDPVSGKRVMSQLNFSDAAIPTPWYMASFLYRFYNGSSSLKCIPFTAGAVAEAFISLDEDLAVQAIVPTATANGQPVYQQLQQMSNAFEVRSPYYRAVRCDVVDSNQSPVLGDVRTCVRLRNLGGYGSTTATSDLYEAAGDDFNFFFMVGPPPMVDIRNVADGSVFPTGTTRTINLSQIVGVTNETTPFTGIAARNVTFSPTLEQKSPTEFGNISFSTREFLPVKLQDQSESLIRVTDCKIARHPSVVPTLYLPTTEPIDLDETSAVLKTVPEFSIVDDY